MIGVVGEVDPETLKAFELTRERSAGSVDLNKLALAPRRSLEARPVSRFPSSDVDLAFVVADSVPAGAIWAKLEQAAGDLCESVDGSSMSTGARGFPKTRGVAIRN